MNDTARITLSAAQRGALRSALKSHTKWADYRREKGVEISGMSVTELLAAASALEVAPTAYMDAIASEPSITTTYYSAPAVTVAPRNRDITPDAIMNEALATIMNNVAPRLKTPAEMAASLSEAQVSARRHKEEGMNAEEAAIVARAKAERAARETVVSAPADDTASQLASLLGKLAGGSLDPEKVRAIVDAQIEERFRAMPPVRIEVKAQDGVSREVEGHKHPKLEVLMRAACSRMANGFAPNVWIAGPAGSGKTHAGEQIAKALGVEFHTNGAISQEFQLLGFRDAGGNYHDTPFRKAYEFGGVYMYDEVDGSDNAALLALNAALANGRASFPDAMVTRHKDCVILASANTWGLGATAEYVGRAKIDAAFLSRFPVRISWEYDTALELNISGNAKFAQRVIDARARAKNAGLKVLIDPRASQAGAALIAAGMSSDEAAKLTYLANLSKDQRKMVEGI